MTTPTEAAPPAAAPPTSGIVAALLAAVKALPLSDQEVFTKLFREWASAEEPRPAVTESPEEGVPVKWPDFAGRVKETVS